MSRLSACLLLITAGAALFAQAPGKKPVFEAAAIKPTDPKVTGSHWNSSTGHVTMSGQTLKRLVMIAYDMQPYQVEGGPKWFDSDRYDINAKLEDAVKTPGVNSDIPIKAALADMLADRFQLKFHRDRKIMSAYAMVVAKSGLKLHEVEDTGHSSSNSHNGTLTAKGVSMERLASFLSRQMDRPVEDLTGIKGVFNFTLEWAPESNRPPDAPADQPTGPSIFTALQEQLGLRLETKKVPVEIIVVDSAEKPTEN